MTRFLRCLLILAVVWPPLASLAQEPGDIEQLLAQASEARSSNPDRFAELLEELGGRQDGLTPAQSNFYDYLVGYRAAFEGRFSDAVDLYRQVFERSDDPSLRFRVGYSLANVHSITRDWTEGLLQLNITMAELSAIEDKQLRRSGLLAAAIFYNQLEQFDLGLSYVSQAIDPEINQRNLCFANQLRIEALLNLGRLDPSATSIDDGIADCEAMGELVVANTIRNNVAQAHVDQSRFQSASETLVPQLAAIEATGYKRLIAESYALLSQAAAGLGNWQVAAEHAQRALVYAEDFPISEPTVQAYSTLKNYYRQNGDFEQALNYQTRYSEAEAGYQDDRARKQLAVELANQEVEKKIQQIELLSEQNRVLELREALAGQVAAKNRLAMYLAGVLALSLAGWISLQLRSQRRLKRLAERDSLTGLSNRRHFTESAASLLSYCEGRKQDACIIMLDLDHFKKINDNYGHSAGDWTLQTVADTMQSLARQNDLIGRIGGEEFVLLLPSCDIDTGVTIAEKYRQAIASIDCSRFGPDVHISASLGVTSCALSGYALRGLMRDSDLSLYAAKHQGRDQYVQFDPAIDQGPKPKSADHWWNRPGR